MNVRLILVISGIAAGATIELKMLFNSDQPNCIDSVLDEGTLMCQPVNLQRYPTLDGSCNNQIDKRQGKAFIPLKRLLPAEYENKKDSRKSANGEKLPNARALSNLLHDAVDERDADVNHMFTQWGQYIIHDIVHTPELNVTCECGDDDLGEELVELSDDDQHHKECFPMKRSSPTPSLTCTNDERNQLNQISAFIDGTTVYGTSQQLNDELREPDSPLLKISDVFTSAGHGETLPVSSKFKCPLNMLAQLEGCFSAGDLRVNENAGLTSMHTLFMREHNRIARELMRINPHWDAETVYHESRLVIIAMHQVITYKEYLPHLVGPKFLRHYGLDILPHGFYYGYDSSIDASISNEFTTAAFRFGHSMVPDHLSLVTKLWEYREKVLDMKSALFNPASWLNETHSSVDDIIRGLLADNSKATNWHFPEALKDFLFAEESDLGLDLFAINIQRGREHGLSSYNDYREFFGMHRVNNFDELLEIKSNLQEALASIYTSVNDIDVYVGGLAETPVDGGQVGPLFAHMIASQFSALKRGDRFYFENGGAETIFTHVQLDELRKLSLSSLICSCTDSDEVYESPFGIPSRYNQRKSCADVYQLDLSLWNKQPFVFGFKDSCSWSRWIPVTNTELPKYEMVKTLYRERPEDMCREIMGVEERLLPMSKQIRFECPAGVLTSQMSGFPTVDKATGKWTVWFDSDTPGLTGRDDVEQLDTLLKRRPGHVCPSPLQIQVQTVTGVPAYETGQVFDYISPHRGFACFSNQQLDGESCHDYRVRYFCRDGTIGSQTDAEKDDYFYQWTQWTNTDQFPDAIENERRQVRGYECQHALDVEARVVDTHQNALTTGQIFRVFDATYGIICDDFDQHGQTCFNYEVRFYCGRPKSLWMKWHHMLRRYYEG